MPAYTVMEVLKRRRKFESKTAAISANEVLDKDLNDVKQKPRTHKLATEVIGKRNA